MADPANTPPADPPAGDPPATPPADPPAAPPAEGNAGLKSALDKERDARKAAEKAAKEGKDAIKRLAELEAANQTETEKLQKERDDAIAAVNATTSTIRDANLKLALSSPEHGFASPKLALLAVKEHGVEFDDDHNPTNLEEVIAAVVAAEPALVGTPTKPKPPSTNSGDGKQEGPKIDLTAEELAAADAAGKTPEEWQALKGVKNIEDFNALQAQKNSG